MEEVATTSSTGEASVNVTAETSTKIAHNVDSTNSIADIAQGSNIKEGASEGAQDGQSENSAESEIKELILGKFKTNEDVQNAYTELEKKFGGLSGAPKEGYKIELEEHTKNSGWDMNESEDTHVNAILKDVLNLAQENNVNNEFCNKMVNGVLNIFQMEEKNYADQNQQYIESELKALGPDATETIQKVVQFGKNHLPAELHDDFVDMLQSASAVKCLNKLREANSYSQPAQFEKSFGGFQEEEKLWDIKLDPSFKSKSLDYQKSVMNQLKALNPGDYESKR